MFAVDYTLPSNMTSDPENWVHWKSILLKYFTGDWQQNFHSMTQTPTKELELLAPTAYSINDQLPTKCLGFSTWLEKGVIVSVLIPKPTVAVDKLVGTTKLGSWNAQRQGLKRYLIPGHLSTKFRIHCKNLINYSDSKPQGVNWGLHK